MILLDVNQVMFATLFASIGKHTNIKIEEPLIRHMALNAIRNINSKFRNEYGPLIICNDSRTNWRRVVFPFYKAGRKKSRDQSDLDWKAIFQTMGNIKEELRTLFPYKFLDVEGAEADDIIGTICGKVFNEKILIVSGDKDYRQLHRANVQQYDPIQSRFIQESEPQQYLVVQIMRGDASDGIPNVASPDNTFVINQRQKKITRKLLDELTATQIDSTNKYYRNYMRNKTLIDLREVPNDIKSNIIDQFSIQVSRDKSNLLPYFQRHKLKQLVEHVNDF